MNNSGTSTIEQLQEYQNEHQEISQLLDEYTTHLTTDQLTIQRLKKRKLWLKDQIILIKNALYPDIIA